MSVPSFCNKITVITIVIQDLRTEQVGLEVTLKACIREVICSDPGRDSGYPEVFVVFLNPSCQMQGQYLC
jgi:hypothetical protein